MRDPEEIVTTDQSAHSPKPVSTPGASCLSLRERLGCALERFRTGLRRLYAWTLHWAETPQAPWALFLVAFVESSVFPIPPDALLIALVLATPRRFLRYAFVCTLGSVLGGILGYLIGYAFMETLGWRIIDFYHARDLWAEFQMKYHTYGLIFLAVAAFTPIPYKVATIASGATEIALSDFVLISALGRGARFFLVAGLLHLFGEPIRAFIEKYFDVLSLLFVVLLLGGFLLLGYIR